MKLEPTQWTLCPVPVGEHQPVHIDRVRKRDGTDWYAIRQGGVCMDTVGDWEFEPLPSNRTEEWLQRFRFPTLADAQEAVFANIRDPRGRFVE